MVGPKLPPNKKTPFPIIRSFLTSEKQTTSHPTKDKNDQSFIFEVPPFTREAHVISYIQEDGDLYTKYYAAIHSFIIKGASPETFMVVS